MKRIVLGLFLISNISCLVAMEGSSISLLGMLPSWLKRSPNPSIAQENIINRHNDILNQLQEHNELSQEEKESAQWGAPIKDMETALARAPQKAINILNYLKDQHFYSKHYYRSAFFVGEPGSGKSTLACAIAYKSGWNSVLMGCEDVQGGQRNDTAHKLHTVLTNIVNKKEKTVVIFDELNQLLENYDSTYYDTDMTSKVLWNFLDKQKYNSKFFFIGTMNRIDKLPKPFKSRILARCIELFPPNPEQRKAIFLEKLIDNSTQLHPEVTESFLKIILQDKEVAKFNGRDFEELALLIDDVYRRENPVSSPKIIRKKHIEQALKEFKYWRTCSKYGQKEETEEERQERYHREQMEIARRQLEIQQDELATQEIAANLQRMTWAASGHD